jgi:hypothetical protein
MRTRAAVLALTALLSASSAAFAAGDVTAVRAARGELQITGDDFANDVLIERDLMTMEMVVRGRNGTTVNGAAEFRVPGFHSVRATMNGGDDVLTAAGFNVHRHFYVDLGEGDDALNLVRVVVLGRAYAYGKGGGDTIRFEAGCDLRAGGIVLADEGANHVVVADSYVRGPLRIWSGAGDDLVEIHRCGFTSKAALSIRTGDGADVVDFMGNTFQGAVETLTFGGVDKINVRTSRFRRAVGMNTGDDDDEVTVERCTFEARYFIGGGDGTNNVFFIAIHFSSGSSNVAAGGTGHSGHFWWAFVIIHVFP